MVKRIISFVLSIGMLFTANIVFAAQRSKDTSFSEGYEMLNSFGIKWNAENAEDDVSIADYRTVMVSLLDTVNTPTSKETEAIAERMGFIPSAATSVKVKYALNAGIVILGYDKLAQYNQAEANNIKYSLMPVSAVSTEDVLTNEMFVQFLKKLLDTDIVTQEFDSTAANMIYKVSKGKTLLNHRFDIYEAKGVMNANEIADMDGGKRSRKNMYEIESHLYYSETDYNEFLGRRVKYYYRDNSKRDAEDDLLYVLSDKNEVFTKVNTEDIAEVNASHIKAYSETGKAMRYDYESTWTIIYNFRPVESSSQFKIEDLLSKTEGYIEIIDTDGSGSADLLKVYDFKTYYVNSTDLEKRIVFDKECSKGTLEIDEDKMDMLWIRNAQGKDIAFEELAAGNVLSVAQSLDGEVALVWVSNEGFTTSVSGFSKSENDVVINGIDYTVVKEYRSAFPDFKSGDTLITSLDVFGKIAYIEVIKEYDFMYGLYLGFWPSESGEDDGVIKIFTMANRAEVFNLAEHIIIDGKYYKSVIKAFAEKSADFASGAGLIGFKLDMNGKVKEIDISDTQYTSETDTLKRLATDEKYHFYDTSSVLRSTDEADGYMPRFFVSERTKIFVIPDNGSRDTKYYRAYTESYLADYTQYNVDIYSTDIESLSTDFVVVYLPQSAINVVDQNTTDYILVNKCSLISNSDNETVISVSGINPWTGAQITMEAYPENVTGVKNGSLIIYATDNMNMISDVEIVYSTDDGYLLSSNPHQKTGENGYTSQQRILKGKIWLKTREFIQVALTDESGSEPLAPDMSTAYFGNTELAPFYTNLRVYEIDTSLQKPQFEKADTLDLLDYKNNGDSCSDVIVIMRSGSARSILIIK